MESLLAVFRNPDLRRLVLGWAGMTVTTWVFAIALAVYAFGEGGPTAVGVAALVRMLPGALGVAVRGSTRRPPPAPPRAGAERPHERTRGSRWPRGRRCRRPGLAGLRLCGVFTVASTPYVPAEGALLPLLARTPQELSAANVAHNQTDSLGFPRRVPCHRRPARPC